MWSQSPGITVFYHQEYMKVIGGNFLAFFFIKWVCLKFPTTFLYGRTYDLVSCRDVVVLWLFKEQILNNCHPLEVAVILGLYIWETKFCQCLWSTEVGWVRHNNEKPCIDKNRVSTEMYSLACILFFVSIKSANRK